MSVPDPEHVDADGATLAAGAHADLLPGPDRRFVGEVVRLRADGHIDVLCRVRPDRLRLVPAEQVVVIEGATPVNPASPVEGVAIPIGQFLDATG